MYVCMYVCTYLLQFTQLNISVFTDIISDFITIRIVAPSG
jgi:hypothetical protein